MAKQFDHITEQLQEFIAKQKLFFVATTGKGGKINLSPKGLESFRVVNSRTIQWLNLTGSGNETAAHLLEDDRMTIMFCSFDKNPLILRLYGTAKSIHKQDAEWDQNISFFPSDRGSRQIIEMNIEMVQTSCGFGVPIYKFEQERTTLKDWTDKKSDDDIEAYWKEKNTISIDGKPTGLFD